MKYKVKIKDVVPSPTYNEHDDCFLGISINNPILIEHKINLVLEWINNNFNHCIILIGDHLHRINEYVLFGRTGNQATVEAEKRGVQIERLLNNSLQNFPDNKFVVEHWKNYNSHPDFKKYNCQLTELYSKNHEFQKSIYSEATKFIEKQIDRGCHVSMEKSKAIEYSIEYLLEEMAVFSILIKIGYNVQVYPGTQLNILKELANGKFPDIDTNLKNGIYIDLTVKKIK